MSETKNEKQQPKKPFPERLGGGLSSWMNVVVAVTALLGALIGLYLAGVKAWHAIHPQASGPTASYPAVTPSSRPGHSPSPRPRSSPLPGPRSSPPSNPTYSPAGEPKTGPGTKLYSGEVNVLNGDGLTYETAAGNQILFTYYGSLGYLSAGANVNLAVLGTLAPTPSAAYQACEQTGNYTDQVTLNQLPVGSTLCAFTPNNQVVWIRILGTETGQSAFDMALHVEAISWQGPNS